MMKIDMYRICFIVFLCVIPFGVIGSILYMFNYPVVSYLKYLRGGGYILGAFLFIILIPYLISDISNTKNPKSNFLFCFLFPIIIIATFVIQIIIHYDMSGIVASSQNKSALGYNWPILVSYVSLFFVGFGLLQFSIEYKVKIIFLWLLCCLLIFLNVDYHFLSLDFSSSIEPSNKAFTLILSDSFSILSLIVIGLYGVKSKSILIFIISFLCLFFISSRTALIIFSISFFIFYIINLKGVKSAMSLIAILILTFFCILYLFDNSTGYAARLFSLNFQDHSVSGRMNMLSFGVNQIANNFFTGDFGGQVYYSYDESGARWGGYIHNVLSFFRQFGFCAFISVIMVFVYSIYSFFLNKNSVYKNIFLLISLYIILAYIISRSYVYPWFFLLPGMCLTINYKSSE